jgi:hypothetical protein
MNFTTTLKGALLTPLLLAIACPIAGANLAPVRSGQAPSLSPVNQGQARQYPQSINIFAGRNSAIEFNTGETIQFIQLSDPSLIVFNTNAPVESGQANVILLRVIQPLNFPGVVRSLSPNLTVTTDSGTYFFDLRIIYDSQPNTVASGVAIVPGNTVSTLSNRQTVIDTSIGRGTADHIRRGLFVAIEKGYTPWNDPIVERVETAVVLMRQGTPLTEIANTLSDSSLPQVLEALAELGLQNPDPTPRI